MYKEKVANEGELVWLKLYYCRPFTRIADPQRRGTDCILDNYRNRTIPAEKTKNASNTDKKYLFEIIRIIL